jgi:hypothetical protein
MGTCMGGGAKNLTPAKFMENEIGGYQMWVSKIKNSSNTLCIYPEYCSVVSQYVSNFIDLLPENNPDGAHACIIFLSSIQQLMS